MEKVTLQTLKSGAVIDLFNVEFEKNAYEYQR